MPRPNSTRIYGQQADCENIATCDRYHVNDLEPKIEKLKELIEGENAKDVVRWLTAEPVK